MKAAVITFPGSNCDDDLVYALEKSGFEVDRLWHKNQPSLSEYFLIGIPGGFSFGDYLRCGAVASRSPILEAVKSYADEGGLVIGICNGFQILCESGLLPGALVRNDHTRFICRDVPVRVKNADRPWTSRLKPNQVLSLPIAHGEGRYVIDEKGYETLKSNDQILLEYCDNEGKTSTKSNPNGSAYDIAGICNANGNVFGLMPHPERATDLRSEAGRGIWESVLSSLNTRSAQ